MKADRRGSDEQNSDQKVPSSSPADSTVDNDSEKTATLKLANSRKAEKPAKLRFKVS